jgi:hypothetical protein
MNNNHLYWAASDSKDNALATASKTAEAGKTHFFKRIIVSFTAAPAAPKLIQLKKGTTVFLEMYADAVKQAWNLDGLPGNDNEAISVEVAASGAGGNLCKVALIGYTQPG